VSEDAGIEPRTVAITALAVRRSSHSARSHPHSARSQRSEDLNRNCQTCFKRKKCNIFPSFNPRKLDLNPDSITLSFVNTDTEIIFTFEVLNMCVSFSVGRSGLLASRGILGSRVATDVQVPYTS
jgi:hypothetical protein